VQGIPLQPQNPKMNASNSTDTCARKSCKRHSQIAPPAESDGASVPLESGSEPHEPPRSPPEPPGPLGQESASYACCG
jgi:hypothetical protein